MMSLEENQQPRREPRATDEPLSSAQNGPQQALCTDTCIHSSDVDEKDECSSMRNTTRNETNMDDEEQSARKVWQQWVPMERSLHQAVQLIQLCMLQKVHELLENAGVKYWICGGTLLGAIRHGGLIPHDDDVDIECFASDLETIAALPTEPPFYTGFEVLTTTWEGHPVAQLHFFRGEFSVDIFPRPRDLPMDRHFASQDEVFPLRRFRFHNIELWGPGKADSYLNRCYGNNWRDTVSIWNHDYNGYHLPGFHPEKTILSLQDYKDVIQKAGVVPPVVEGCAADMFQKFCDMYGDAIYQDYSNYRFQRTWRQNRAVAEWKEQQQNKN